MTNKCFVCGKFAKTLKILIVDVNKRIFLKALPISKYNPHPKQVNICKSCKSIHFDNFYSKSR